MSDNIDKIKQLVEDLSIRDQDLLDKVEHFDILQQVFLTSPRAMAIMKEDWKYANTLGKANARRIKIHEDEVAEKAKLQKEKEERHALMQKARRDPRRVERDYCYWTNAHEVSNYWDSIEDYERYKNKKNKKFTGYY